MGRMIRKPDCIECVDSVSLWNWDHNIQQKDLVLRRNMDGSAVFFGNAVESTAAAIVIEK